MKRLALGLLLSCAAHAAVVAGVVAALEFTAPHVLFLDLVHGLGLAVPGGGSGGGGSSGEPGSGDKAEPRAAAPPRRAPAARRGLTARGAEAPQPSASGPVSAPLVTPTPEPQRTPSAIAAVEPTPPATESWAVSSPPPDTPPVTSTPPDPRALPAPSSSLAAAAAPSPMGIGCATSGAARGGEAGRADGADERGARAGHGGPGGGGGLGAGAGVNQGSAVALAVPGDGAGVPPEYEGYFMLLRSRLHEAIRYPAVARRRSLTGQVVIEVRVTASGEIDRARIVVSSLHSVLDEAALEAARGLRVPFPPGLRPRTLSMRLPVNFVLQ